MPDVSWPGVGVEDSKPVSGQLPRDEHGKPF